MGQTAQYSAYDNQLGIITSINWSFNDQGIAVASYDDTVCDLIFNTMAWRIVSQFQRDKKLNKNLNNQERHDDEKEREQETES